MPKYGLGELIGSGTEKSVYKDSKNPGRVVSLFRDRPEYKAETPNQIIGRGHLTKILHLLLPKTIPDIYDWEFEPAALVSEEIKMDQDEHALIAICDEMIRKGKTLPPDLAPIYREFFSKVTSSKEFGELKDLLERLGIQLDAAMMSNFVFDDNDEFKYLDNNFHISSHQGQDWTQSFDGEALRRLIEKMPDARREKALKYYDRLMLFVNKDRKEWQAVNNGQNDKT